MKQYGLLRVDLRAFRSRLRALPDQLRSLHHRRHREVPQIRARDGMDLRKIQGFGLGRTRRRSDTRGTAADHVRRPVDACVLGVQDRIRSREQDESRKGRAALSHRRKPALGRELPAVGSANQIHAERRSSQLRLCGEPLRRRGRVPKARQRDDVPQLHGIQRGALFHPRARASAVRNASGQSDEARLEERSGQGITGLLSGMQRLQARVPGERRHGDVQSRVFVPLFSRQTSPHPDVPVRLHVQVGETRRTHARRSQLFYAGAAVQHVFQADRQRRSRAAHSDVRRVYVPRLVPQAHAAQRRKRARAVVDRYVEQSFPPADCAGSGRSARRRGISRPHSTAVKFAADGRCTTTDCWIPRKSNCTASSRICVR